MSAAIPTTIVAAIADNGVIGRDNRLIWHLRTDLRRFRDLTMGRPLIMGRRTFDSIGRALPGRRTIVLTRDRAFAAESVAVAHDWEGALALATRLADGASEAAVAGGAEIYALALPGAARLHLTFVHVSPEGDTRFPPVPPGLFREVCRSRHPAGPDDEHPYTFVDYDRVPAG